MYSKHDAGIVDKIQPARIIERLERLGEIGRSSQGGITRLAFSEEDRLARAMVTGWMSAAGLEVEVSPIGNILGRLDGANPAAPAVMTGSHIDTVIEAGKFDGALGVIAGIEIAQAINESGLILPCPFEVVCFVMEESSRFGVSYTFGSKVMTGQTIKDELLLARDRTGKSLAEAIDEMRSREVATAGTRRRKDDVIATVKDYIRDSQYPMERVKAFVELHIEQGPSLYVAGKPVGVVTAIAAPTRFRVTLLGEQGHTGTTPMRLRKDALTAAAEAILAVEQECGSTENVVGTASVIDVEPNVINQIPGKAQLSIDIRSVSAEAKEKAAATIREKIERLAARRGVLAVIDVVAQETPQTLSERVAATVEQSCSALGLPSLRLPSGAGHDAAQMARFVRDTGMLFVPSRDGISHAPQEWTDEQDIVRGTQVLMLTLLDLAQFENQE